LKWVKWLSLLYLNFQTLNGALHCSCMQTVCTVNCLVSAAVGCCSYCKGGRRVPAYVNKAASRENGLSGLTFPYIWYCPSGTCFQLNSDNLLQFPSTVPSSTIARQITLTQLLHCLSSYIKDSARLFPLL